MKKCIAMFSIIIIVISTMFIITFASNNIVLNPIQFNAENNSLTVSGIVKHNRDRIPMTLHISKDGAIIAAEEILAVGTTNGEVPFSFAPVSLNSFITSGDLSITVTASLVEWSATTTYHYYGVDKQLEAMKKIQEAIDGEDETALVGYMNTYTDALSLDIDEFADLSDTSDDIALASLMDRQYTLPDNYSTKEECTLIQTAVKQFLLNYQEAINLGRFFDLNSTAELKAWYDANKSVYNLLNDDAETEPDESKMVSYFEGILQTDEYLDRKIHMDSATSMKELNLLMKHQALLQTVKDSNQYAVRNILVEFPQLLTSVNYNDWNNLTSASQSVVCAAVTGISYGSIELFTDAVNTAISDVNSVKESGGSSGGGGFGGGGKLFDGTGTSSNVAQPALPFTDIEHVTWAKDSILYLYKNQIVSGKDAVTFAPDDQVTRAELVKMLVCGLKLDTQSKLDTRFNDVYSEAWYAEFVSVATEHGLINGDEYGNFNPESPISRQDAATIMYRALNTSEKVESAYFEDYSYIADYAKIAVDYMCAKGVINGIGDGLFAPHAKLTRAQAAKMLHLMLVLQ